MNRLLIALKRPFVRLHRLPAGRGYGVHSPFAFNLITQVVHQPTPYYKYKSLAEKEKQAAKEKGKHWLYESRKFKQMLFRLVNYVQPQTIVDVGTLSASALYLQAGCERADYTAATSPDELFLEAGVPVDFLYLHDWQHPEPMEEVFKVCVKRTRQQSLFVIEGIGYSAAMRNLWERIRQDERTGITFDAYDVGLVFFDKSKLKQHYKI